MPIYSPGAWPPQYPPFIPRPWLHNPHLQTVLASILPRHSSLPRPVTQLVEVSPATSSQITIRSSSQVLCECHWQPLPQRPTRPTAILVHGLEGSAHSQYIIGNANKLWRAGCNVIRMNMRNCGGPGYDMARLTPTLYHSGLSSDVDRVLRFFLSTQHLESVALIGYSMGGNLVLKLAGDLAANAPPQLSSVVAVSPAADLAQSADALHLPSNRFYERRFLRSLLKRFRRKALLFPRAYNPLLADQVATLRQFDDRITALYSGFRSADDYYHRAAAARVLDRITLPTLILHAADDPFIRFTPETLAKIDANPNITLLESEYGGHCAFLGIPSRSPGDDGYWAELTALRFILAHAETPAANS